MTVGTRNLGAGGAVAVTAGEGSVGAGGAMTLASGAATAASQVWVAQ
jgi:hypothetical protein